VEKSARIFVAGSGTLIGSAIVRRLKGMGFANVCDPEPDYVDPKSVDAYFAEHCPQYVFVAAGKSGGISANQKLPAELMLDNLLVACHVVQSAFKSRSTKLLYLGSSCCYPKLCAQPMRVEHLFTGPLEPTNDAYALAKLAGIQLCQAYRRQYGMDFISAIPANVFGPGDDFSLEDSHVIAALIRKFHEAKAQNASDVEIWGTGTPRREFIYADDLADGCIFAMNHYSALEPMNIGIGADLSIRQLAQEIQTTIGYSGRIRFNSQRPDGMPVKLLDSSLIAEMGWKPRTDFRSALEKTYHWFTANNPKT
jgi:GDP-L-fucose synthase